MEMEGTRGSSSGRFVEHQLQAIVICLFTLGYLNHISHACEIDASATGPPIELPYFVPQPDFLGWFRPKLSYLPRGKNTPAVVWASPWTVALILSVGYWARYRL